MPQLQQRQQEQQKQVRVSQLTGSLLETRQTRPKAALASPQASSKLQTATDWMPALQPLRPRQAAAAAAVQASSLLAAATAAAAAAF